MRLPDKLCVFHERLKELLCLGVCPVQHFRVKLDGDFKPVVGEVAKALDHAVRGGNANLQVRAKFANYLVVE